jgi:hypothetical protein
MEHLHNWVFNFNPYTKQWAAIPREIYNEYWNNFDVEGIIKSSSFTTLLEIVNKTEGVDVEKKLNID